MSGQSLVVSDKMVTSLMYGLKHKITLDLFCFYFLYNLKLYP